MSGSSAFWILCSSEITDLGFYVARHGTEGQWCLATLPLVHCTVAWMKLEPGLLSDSIVASYHESDLLVLTSHVLFHLGLIIIPQCPTHRCPVWCVGTKVLLAANSIFHLCTNTTNEDQPMVSKLFHARLTVVFQDCYLMLICVVLLIKCCLCFMEGWGFCIISMQSWGNSQPEAAAMKPKALVRI